MSKSSGNPEFYLAMAVLVAIFVVMPILWLTATVSACGWKGLFVECRIMDCPK